MLNYQILIQNNHGWEFRNYIFTSEVRITRSSSDLHSWIYIILSLRDQALILKFKSVNIGYQAQAFKISTLELVSIYLNKRYDSKLNIGFRYSMLKQKIREFFFLNNQVDISLLLFSFISNSKVPNFENYQIKFKYRINKITMNFILLVKAWFGNFYLKNFSQYLSSACFQISIYILQLS